MDWNADGKKDLLTGENNGAIRIYLNTGTDANPAFSGHTFLKVSGSNFDAGNYSSVEITDWNNDGLPDVLAGESNGKVWLLVNRGTLGNPIFTSKPYVQDGSSNLTVGSVSTPCVVDWNRDGKKDLLVGETYGTVHFFENQGIDEDPVFNGSAQLQAGAGTLDVGYYARPFAADWNGDDVKDILCGTSDGFVFFYEAMGPLALSANTLSASSGGRLSLSLDAGPSNGGRNYLILGTVSGTSPGIPLPGGQVVLPINWDQMTNIGLMLLNTPAFDNFLGTLDVNGQAPAKLDLMHLPGAAGLYMHFAYALNNPWDYVSNAAAIEILP